MKIILWTQRLLWAVFGTAFFVFSSSAFAESKKVRLNDLYAQLAHGQGQNSINENIKRYPKLAGILDKSLGRKTISSPNELTGAISAHLSSYKALFSAMDINRDGKISPLEILQREPRMAAYFRHLDQDRDGYISWKEFLTSRIQFNLKVRNKSSLDIQSVGAITSSSQLPTSAYELPTAIEQYDTTDRIGYLISNFDQWQAQESIALNAFFSRTAQKSSPDDPEEIIVVAPPEEEFPFDTDPIYFPPFDIDPYIASVGGMLCRAGCWGSAGAICAAVSTLCVVGEVITVGTVTIPCTVAIIASCAGVAAAASICSDSCPP
jgi:hypothetical protein